MAPRLRFANSRLPDGSLADVMVEGQRILYVEPSSAPHPDETVVDVGGFLLTPGLTDPHLHPDKAFGLEEADAQGAGSLAEAIARVRAQKPAQTAQVIEARTLRLVNWCIQLGTTRLRLHAEVDPLLGLRSVEGVLAAREALADRARIQVVAFAQEGIVREPGTLELLQEALRSGCDGVGAITYQDPDPREHLELAARLARDAGAFLDVHADFGIPVEQSALRTLAEVTVAYDLQEKTLAGHCTTLRRMPPDAREATLAGLARAGIDICVLPRTDLFIDGCVAPLDAVWAAGRGGWLGTNNIQNAFTPVGRPSLTSAAAVYALAAQLGERGTLDRLACSLWQSARGLGVAEPVIEAGALADLCVWPVHEPWQLVASEAEPAAVYVGGRCAFARQPTPVSVVSREQSQT